MSEILEITWRSLFISGSATFISSIWSIPLAYYIASDRRRGIYGNLLESLVGIPTVLIGLLLYLVLSKQGPLGFLNMLYTPSSIIIGEALLITPLMTSVAYRVLKLSIDTYGELALSLGANRQQAMSTIVKQSIPGIVSSVIMAFSRAIGELGVALLVGGNIRGYTRTITTAIALEVSKGEFTTAIQLGSVLVAIMVVISISLRLVRDLQ